MVCPRTYMAVRLPEPFRDGQKSGQPFWEAQKGVFGPFFPICSMSLGMTKNWDTFVSLLTIHSFIYMYVDFSSFF